MAAVGTRVRTSLCNLAHAHPRLQVATWDDADDGGGADTLRVLVTEGGSCRTTFDTNLQAGINRVQTDPVCRND